MAWREDAKFNKLRGTSLYLGSGLGTEVTSTAAELNIMDGVTSTYAELNILDGVTSTYAELNILDGTTANSTELNMLDGMTGPVDGVAAGYHLARGSQAVTTSAAINTGLTSIVEAVATVEGSAVPSAVIAVTCKPNATGATLNVYGWKHTSAATTTLIAATAAATISWIAVGT